MRVDADGILVFHYQPGCEVDIHNAREVVAEASTLVDRPHPTLILFDGARSVSREARHFFATSAENRALCSRVAMLIGSPVSRVIGNFFLGLNRTSFPIRLFDDESSARAWLRESA